MTADLEPTSTAVLDPTGTYRYHLTRVWGDGPRLLLCMINPSKADHSANDPTIVRCIGFGKREGMGGIGEVAADVIGKGGKLVVAWGPKPWARERIGYVVREILRPFPLYCLGVSKDGSPRHPLMVKLDQPLIPWPVAA
jgi:hypothetical protein